MLMRIAAAIGRPRLSIGAKLALSTLLVLSLVTTLAAEHFIERTRQHLFASKAMAAGMIADISAVALAPSLDFSDTESVQAELANVRENKSLLAAAVWGHDPTPIASIGRKDSELAVLRKSGADVRVSPEVVLVGRPILRSDGHRLGTLVMMFSLSDENAAFAAARKDILQLTSLAALVTAVLLLALSRFQIVRPLEELVAAARSLGSGDRSVRVRLERSDEFGRLAEGFNAMSSAIVERESKLEMATRSLRELFDNMQQGIVSFGADGKLDGDASRQAAALFGERVRSGTSLVELLYGHNSAGVEAEALGEWIEVAFESNPRDWSQLAGLAPREIWLSSQGDRKYIRLEFRPVYAGERVARIMLLATDETQLRVLATQVKTKEQEHARQLAAMRQLIAGGGQVFVRFIEVARERIERGQELLSNVAQLTPGAMDELMQHVHTVRGEARAFELEGLAAEAMALEDELSAIRLRLRSEGVLDMEGFIAAWRRRLKRMGDALAEAQSLFVAASPIGEAILDQVTVSRRDVHRLNELAGQQKNEIGQLVRRLAARPFGEIVAPLVQRVPGWADVVGKRVRMEIEGKDVLLPPELARLIPGVITHLVRNAIAHGVELPEDRVRARKHECAAVIATCMQENNTPVVVVEDDGSGIDFDSLAARAGIDPADLLSARELLFTSGVSTANDVSELAGRGVGLAAVRSELSAIGWTIDVDSARRTGSAFIIRPRGRISLGLGGLEPEAKGIGHAG
jgi:two-component system chemotaxis sensor kinase CheA